MAGFQVSPEFSADTFWENTARTRWGSYISELERRTILRAHELAREKRANTALDVGCEGGRWSLLLANLGWNLICTDIYPENLAICQSRLPSAKCVLVERDSQALPCDSSTIGLLMCIEVNPVIHTDWFISEAFRVLCDGGLLVGVFLNKASVRALIHRLSALQSGEDRQYYLAYSEWKSKLRRQGFHFISEEGFCWGPFSRQSNSKWVPIFAEMERRLGLRKLPAVSPWVAVIAKKVVRDSLNASLDDDGQES